jgi:hypothetical protein
MSQISVIPLMPSLAGETRKIAAYLAALEAQLLE